MNTQTFFFVQLGFAALTIVFSILLMLELKAALIRTSIDAIRQKKIFFWSSMVLSIWIIAIGAISTTGFFTNFNLPPRALIVMVFPLAVVIWLLNNKTATVVIKAMSAVKLAGLQVFRVFVEILLWALFAQGLLPEQMTFEGRNFDILAGISGPIIALLIYHKKVSRGLVIAWNIVCLGLLFNIVATAVLSMPTPFRVFMNEPANTIVTVFPIIWLPAFLVPLAYTLHLCSLKQIQKL